MFGEWLIGNLQNIAANDVLDIVIYRVQYNINFFLLNYLSYFGEIASETNNAWMNQIES